MRVLTGFAFVMAATVSGASVTVLNSIPIADILANREAMYIYTASAAQGSNRYAHAHSLELGLFDKIELGFDNDFAGETVWNAKVALFDNPKFAKNTAFSIGALNVKDNMRTDWFAVGRYDFEKCRVHGGVMWNDGVCRAMIGLDFELIPGLTFMAEHIGGAGDYSWAGLSWAPAAIPGLSIGGGFGSANRKSDGNQHYLTAGYGFRF